MLRDRVEQSLNAIGTDVSVTLGAVTPGMRGFLPAFGAGQDAFYTIESGDMWEAGVGRTNGGPPETFSRNEVIANSLGTTARLDFTGAAVIYNALPAARVVYKQQLEAETAARNAAIATVSAALVVERTDRSSADTGLSNYVKSVDDKLAQRTTELRNEFYKSDADFYTRITNEQKNTPYLQTALLYGGWNGTSGFDPANETVFFDVGLPVGARKVICTMNCRIYAPGTPGQSGTGIIFRAYALYGNATWMVSTQPSIGVECVTGVHGAESQPFVLEFPVNAPPGCLLRFTAIRPSGNALCYVIKFDAAGFAIVGG